MIAAINVTLQILNSENDLYTKHNETTNFKSLNIIYMKILLTRTFYLCKKVSNESHLKLKKVLDIDMTIWEQLWSILYYIEIHDDIMGVTVKYSETLLSLIARFKGPTRGLPGADPIIPWLSSNVC